MAGWLTVAKAVGGGVVRHPMAIGMTGLVGTTAWNNIVNGEGLIEQGHRLFMGSDKNGASQQINWSQQAQQAPVNTSASPATAPAASVQNVDYPLESAAPVQNGYYDPNHTDALGGLSDLTKNLFGGNIGNIFSNIFGNLGSGGHSLAGIGLLAGLWMTMSMHGSFGKIAGMGILLASLGILNKNPSTPSAVKQTVERNENQAVQQQGQVTTAQNVSDAYELAKREHDISVDTTAARLGQRT